MNPQKTDILKPKASHEDAFFEAEIINSGLQQSIANVRGRHESIEQLMTDEQRQNAEVLESFIQGFEEELAELRSMLTNLPPWLALAVKAEEKPQVDERAGFISGHTIRGVNVNPLPNNGAGFNPVVDISFVSEDTPFSATRITEGGSFVEEPSGQWQRVYLLTDQLAVVDPETVT